jgi:hypothetical protein
MNIPPLSTYLHDHLAGSVVISEMLSAALAHEDVRDRDFLQRLYEQISDERTQLADLCDRIGDKESVVKNISAWAAEKIARLKVSASHAPLRHLEFLDTLLTGVRGKLGLWQVMESASPGTFAPLDLPALIKRAEYQLMEITRCRIEAFRLLLTEGTDP